MNAVLKSFIDSFVIVFIVEMFVYSRREEEHVDHLRAVVGVLGKQNIYAKFSNCEL